MADGWMANGSMNRESFFMNALAIGHQPFSHSMQSFLGGDVFGPFIVPPVKGQCGIVEQVGEAFFIGMLQRRVSAATEKKRVGPEFECVIGELQ